MQVPTIDDIRIKSEVETEKTIHLLMVAFFILALIGVPVSISRSFYTGWLPNYTFQIASLAIFTLLLLFRNKLTLTLKINAIVCIALGIAVGDLFLYGLYGNGVLWSLFTLYLLMQFYSKHTVLTVALFLMAIFGISFSMFAIWKAPFPGDMEEFFVKIPSWGATFFSALIFIVMILAISKLQKTQRKKMYTTVEEHSEAAYKTVNTLNEIMSISQELRGTEYLKELAKRISETLSIKYVLIGNATDEKNESVTTEVFWTGESFEDTSTYKLKGTPGFDIFDSNKVCIHSSGVADEYPDDTFLKDNNIESYIGSAIHNDSGKLRGIIALMDTKPHVNAELITSYLEFFAVRIGVEQQRSHLEDDLRNQLTQRSCELEEANKCLEASNEELTRALNAMKAIQ